MWSISRLCQEGTILTDIPETPWRTVEMMMGQKSAGREVCFPGQKSSGAGTDHPYWALQTLSVVKNTHTQNMLENKTCTSSQGQLNKKRQSLTARLIGL